jgi:membrane-associated phospholipid phosphatase
VLRRPVVPIAAAVACLLAAALTYFASVHAGFAQRADLRVLAGFVGVQDPRSYHLASSLAEVFDPAPFAVLAAAVAGLAVARGRLGLGVAAAAAVLGANVTTELLKLLLVSARPPVFGAAVGAHAWPSGHSTAAMSLALALVMVSSPRLRPLAAAAGGLVAVGVSYAVLLLGWHYPSDVAGGFLIAAGWSCLLAAVALRRPSGVRLPARAALGPPAAAAGLIVVAAAGVALARPGEVSAYASEHTTFAVGAAVLAAAGVALAAAVSAALSGSGPAPTAARRRR